MCSWIACVLSLVSCLLLCIVFSLVRWYLRWVVLLCAVFCCAVLCSVGLCCVLLHCVVLLCVVLCCVVLSRGACWYLLDYVLCSVDCFVLCFDLFSFAIFCLDCCFLQMPYLTYYYRISLKPATKRAPNLTSVLTQLSLARFYIVLKTLSDVSSAVLHCSLCLLCTCLICQPKILFDH